MCSERREESRLSSAVVNGYVSSYDTSAVRNKWGRPRNLELVTPTHCIRV